MNIVKTSIIASFALFLTTGIAGADELDDLEVTVRVVETDDDANEVEHELHLPDSASDSAREHAEDDGHENEGEHHSNDDGREDHEDEKEDHEDDKEEAENHEEESGSDDDSTPNT